MSIRLTNFVFRVSLALQHQLCLSDVAARAREFYGSSRITLRSPSPTMLVIRQHKKQTLIIFPNGKLRLMGARIRRKRMLNVHFVEWYKNFFRHQRNFQKCIFRQSPRRTMLGVQLTCKSFTPWLTKSTTTERVMTCPGTWTFAKPNFFPRCSWRSGELRDVNIFATGKCVITGLKHFDEACVVADDINNYVDSLT